MEKIQARNFQDDRQMEVILFHLV